MKSCLVALLAVVIITLAGCGQDQTVEKTPLHELPEGYTLAQAKEDGCVVYENGDISCGQEIWDGFVDAAASGKPSMIRLAFYFQLDAPPHYDTEHEAPSQDQHSKLWVKDLSFNGESYTVRWYEEDAEVVKTYQYLMKYEGKAESATALYSSYLRYVLTNDNAITWDDIFHGAVSSQFGEYIDHEIIYTDLIE